MTNFVNKLLLSLNETTDLNPYNKLDKHIMVSGMKKWIYNILPAELLVMSVKEAVELLVTINESGVFYKTYCIFSYEGNAPTPV